VTWLIGQVALRTGFGRLLSSLIVYGAIIAAIVIGCLWWSAHQYNRGYSAGQSQERIAWEEQRKRDLAKQAADKAATQAEIDRLAAELQLEAQRRKDEQADADLKKAQDASATKQNICLPREVGRALNRVGR
jgi:hypothetical protein